MAAAPGSDPDREDLESPRDGELDPRLLSGIPRGQQRDPAAFVRMTGLLRRKLAAGTAPGQPDREVAMPRRERDDTRDLLLAPPPGVGEAGHSPAADASPTSGRYTTVFRQLRDDLERLGPGEEAAGDPVHAGIPFDSPPDAAAFDTGETDLRAALEHQRTEISSRLLEAEQLLQALERQPREQPDAEAKPQNHRLRRAMTLLRLLTVALAFALAALATREAIGRWWNHPMRPEDPRGVPAFQVESLAPAPEELLEQFAAPPNAVEVEITSPLLPPLLEPLGGETIAAPDAGAPETRQRYPEFLPPLPEMPD